MRRLHGWHDFPDDYDPQCGEANERKCNAGNEQAEEEGSTIEGIVLSERYNPDEGEDDKSDTAEECAEDGHEDLQQCKPGVDGLLNDCVVVWREWIVLHGVLSESEEGAVAVKP